MMPPSPCLASAIAEAIEMHAEHYTRREVDADKALAALANVAASLLADIGQEYVRDEHTRAFLGTVKTVAACKLAERQQEQATVQ